MKTPSELEKETRRPRLRAASMLFGVVTVSSSAGAATHYALCDREGAPACGNIGQLGRPAPPTVIVAPSREEPPVAATYNAPLLVVTISTKVVAPTPQPAAMPVATPRLVAPTPSPVALPVAQPTVDDAGDPAPGNVMTKGGPRRRR